MYAIVAVWIDFKNQINVFLGWYCIISLGFLFKLSQPVLLFNPLFHSFVLIYCLESWKWKRVLNAPCHVIGRPYRPGLDFDLPWLATHSSWWSLFECLSWDQVTPCDFAIVRAYPEMRGIFFLKEQLEPLLAQLAPTYCVHGKMVVLCTLANPQSQLLEG